MAKSKHTEKTGQPEAPEVLEPAGEESRAAEVKAEETVPTYTVNEFTANSRALFGVGPDIVRAAFRTAGKGEATLDEARVMVNAFGKLPAH